MSTSLHPPAAVRAGGPFFLPPWRDSQGRLTGFRVKGAKYLSMLAFLQQQLRADRYLEIGTSTGDSLAVMKGNAVCIDPHFRIARDVWANKSKMTLCQMASDSYFERYDPEAELGGKIELAFIDGMHHFEYVLRDFMNVEEHCDSHGVVVLHDCVPWKFSLTRRLSTDASGAFEPVLGAWTGDVWKALPVLARLRPDLRITFLDCPPTGLVAISRLDGSSRVLRENLPEAIACMRAVPDREENFWNWMTQQVFVDTHQLIADPRLIWDVLGLPPR